MVIVSPVTGRRAVALRPGRPPFALSLRCRSPSCTLSDGYGTLVVDPARYAAYHCKDLLAQRNGLVSREQELRGLMEKASEGPGGGAIAAMAYRTDYETVLSDEKLLQRTLAEKKCELTPTYQSDQGVR